MVQEWYNDIQSFIENQLNDVTPAVLFKVMKQRATDRYHKNENSHSKIFDRGKPSTTYTWPNFDAHKREQPILHDTSHWEKDEHGHWYDP